MKLKNFTLIEILVVVAIIGILAGILLPALSVARLKANTSRTKVLMKGIVTAVGDYRRDYQKLPKTTGYTNSGGDGKYDWEKNTDSYYNLCCGLAFVQSDPSGSTNYSQRYSSEVTALNPKGIRYLDITSNFYTKKDGKYVGFTDSFPVHRSFVIYLDYNYDGKIEIPETGETVNAEAAVLSWGDNGDNGKDPREMIKSWEE